MIWRNRSIAHERQVWPVRAYTSIFIHTGASTHLAPASIAAGEAKTAFSIQERARESKIGSPNLATVVSGYRTRIALSSLFPPIARPAGLLCRSSTAYHESAMKYGQQYADTLQGASSEFQQASIDYKQLKKSIKRIERELQAVGLNAETLKELLNAGEDEREGDSAEAGSGHGRLPSNGVKSTVKKSKSDGSLGRKTLKLSKEAQQRGKARRQARARAQYELAGEWPSRSGVSISRGVADLAVLRSNVGTVENPQPRIKLVFSSASSDSDTESHDDKQASEREELYNRLKQHDSARIVEVSGSDEEPDTADTSEQELFDVPEVGATGSAADIEKRGLLSKMYGQGEMVPASQVTPPGSPTQSERLFTLDNPSSTTINARAANHGEEPEEGIVVLEGPEILLSDLDSEEQDLASSNGTTESQEESADDADAESETGESSELRVHKGLPRVPNGHINGTPDTLSSLMPPASTSRRRTHRHHRRREITIDLAYGTEFFHLLNQALSSLALLLSSSKADFVKRVTALSAAISASASPTTKKSDLYGWREVFSLWIEAQIFESENERSRGERSVEEVEKRLLWFVDQVGRRKCVKRMKSKDSRKALETFVELNQELLQLKR